MHQCRIDGAADVIGDAIALDCDAAGVAIDAHHRDVTAVRIDLVFGLEPAFGDQPRIAARLIEGPGLPSDARSLRTTSPPTISSASGGVCKSSAAISSAFLRTLSA